MKRRDVKLLFNVFEMGIDYGQLMMEEERDGEDMAASFQGVIYSDKYAMPSSQVPRRMPHSEAWRNAKRESYKKFIHLIAEI